MIGTYAIFTRDTTNYTSTYFPHLRNDGHFCDRAFYATHSSMLRWLRVHNARRVAWQFASSDAQPMYQFEAVKVG